MLFFPFRTLRWETNGKYQTMSGIRYVDFCIVEFCDFLGDGEIHSALRDQGRRASIKRIKDMMQVPERDVCATDCHRELDGFSPFGEDQGQEFLWVRIHHRMFDETERHFFKKGGIAPHDLGRAVLEIKGEGLFSCEMCKFLRRDADYR